MKLNSWIISGVVFFLVLIGGVFLFSKDNDANSDLASTSTLPAPSTYEYYWSETCPHCKKVAEFRETWENNDKLQMEEYEIDNSADNRRRFIERGNFCKIDRRQMGVPLLITPEGVCYTGDVVIIDYFKNMKFDQEPSTTTTP